MIAAYLGLFLLAVVLALNSLPFRWIERAMTATHGHVDRTGPRYLGLGIAYAWGGYGVLRINVGRRSLYWEHL